MAVYFEASLEEANGDAAFIAKALGAIARAKGMSHAMQVCPTKVCTRCFPVSAAPASTPFLKSLVRLG